MKLTESVQLVCGQKPISKRDQILRALFNEKWQLPYHIKILLLFERKVYEVKVSRVCNILHV